MDILTKDKFIELKHAYFMQLEEGAVFVYPTDTIYGIGCDATNSEAVKRVRDIKKRTKHPFSVIAPSKEWIRKNCVVNEVVEEYLDKLPGPLTFILRIKNKNCIAKEVTDNTLGVRMPDHWITDLAKEFNRPIVTTSVNLAGQLHINSVKDIKKSLQEKIDFAIDDGKLKNKPSKIFDLTGKEPVQIR